MIDLTGTAADLAWPFAILIAWLAGEFAYRWIGLPRISVYAITGFVLAPSQIGLLPQSSPDMMLLANIALGLLLFEAGHRLNLRWLRSNPWIGITSFTESTFTFAAVYIVARWYELPSASALILATLAMATSPAVIVRVVNEQRSSGQVTERILQLSALNCVLAVLAFKLVVGLTVFRTSGNIGQAIYSSLIVLSASVAMGALFGVSMAALLRKIRHVRQDSTLAFAIAIIFLVALTHSLELSPVLAALTFGLVDRHRRVALNSSQRGFGALGDLLSVLLFVFIAATLDWQKVVAGIELGLVIVAVRYIAKLTGIGIFAHISGISWRKGLLVGTAMMPISAFVILVLEQTGTIGISLMEQLAPLAVAELTLAIFGPILTQRALLWAHEAPDAKES